VAGPAVVDFDGDGLADLAVLTGITSGTTVNLTLQAALAQQNGDGTVSYKPWSTLVSWTSTPGTSSVRVLYAGSEGNRAVFVTSTPGTSNPNPPATTIPSRGIYSVSASGGALVSPPRIVKVNCSVKSAVLARLNGDANADVATLDGSNLLRVYPGDGAGGFAVPSTCATTPFTRVSGSVVLALPNANAADLLIRASINSKNVTLLQNDGSGNFP
jgi:hypothetical protein